MEAMLGAVIRFNPDPPLPDNWTLSDPARQMFLLERRSAINHLGEMCPGRIVNRPSAGRSNASKPLHMTRLEAIGFDVPPWVASSNLRVVESFLASCPEGAVVKATSGLRSHVRMVGNEYVDRLRLGTTPSVIQQYIAGHEAQVHVVGDWVFGSRVDSAVVDYRFDEASVRYQPVEIPPAIASLCREAARSERLELAGLDFRVSGDDRWWCLEMNPVPTFLPYEAATGQPIGDAVIDLITGTREHANRRSPLAVSMAPAYLTDDVGM
jgi:glutathione synthase/RimK-type ligase-like ATP-grasp enzyme